MINFTNISHLGYTCNNIVVQNNHLMLVLVLALTGLLILILTVFELRIRVKYEKHLFKLQKTLRPQKQ